MILECSMKKKFRFLLAVTVPFLLCLFYSCSDYFNELKNSVNDIEVSFKVEHWLQAVDENEYEHAEEEDQILTGLSLSKTNVEAKSFQGFSAKPIKQEKIKRDQSTVVKVYYDRNIISYTFDCDGGEWSDNDQTKIISGRYGTDVIRPEDPGKTGYIFNKWESGVPETFGIDALTFYAKWLPDTGTIYKVERWLQNIDDDDYTLAVNSTENYTGETNSMTEVTPATIDGFNDGVVTNLPIAPDGSTVVKVYYDRNIITYTFNSGNGKFSDNTTSKTISGRYEATVIKPANPRQTGYTFKSWNDSIPAKFGSLDQTFIANWSINSYKVSFVSNGGTSVASKTVDYNTVISAPSAPTKSNYEFIGWYSDSRYSSSYNFSTPVTNNITLYARWAVVLKNGVSVMPSGTSGTAGTGWTYVLFGYWPQTKKASSVTVDESVTKKRGSYTYYLGSDSNWYSKSYSSYNKVEQIKWRVLTKNYNNTGKALLLAENILTNQKYADSSNNYANSSIRNYLNNTFINIAFTSGEITSINTTTVDNSARSTNPDADAKTYNKGSNKYACDKTYDKIFLLSEQEVTKKDYGFGTYMNTDSGNARIHKTSNSSSGNWYLRSPDCYESNMAHGVSDNGLANSTIQVSIPCGVVPALVISLP